MTKHLGLNTFNLVH